MQNLGVTLTPALLAPGLISNFVTHISITEVAYGLSFLTMGTFPSGLTPVATIRINDRFLIV